jgi:hypothetical protein
LTLIAFPVKVEKSQIDGKGVYALQSIPARRKIGELGGTVVPLKSVQEILKTTKRIALVELGRGLALNGMINGNELRYINHSCDPNAYMRVIDKRVEFYALRTIKKNEEITCNYGETHHDGKLKCLCKSPKCKGFI